MSDLRDAILGAAPSATLLNEEIDAIEAVVEAYLREQARLAENSNAVPCWAPSPDGLARCGLLVEHSGAHASAIGGYSEWTTSEALEGSDE